MFFRSQGGGGLPRHGWRNDSRGGGTRPSGPSRKRVPKHLKGPKTTRTTIAIAKKQSKRSKNGPFCYILGPPGPSQEMELMGPGGEGPSRSPPPVSPAMPPVGAPLGQKNASPNGQISGERSQEICYFSTLFYMH